MSNYFKQCLGDSYKPNVHSFHSATHPDIIKKVMIDLEGSEAADVIAALVKQHEMDRQKIKRASKTILKHNNLL